MEEFMGQREGKNERERDRERQREINLAKKSL
jgi:hypothetical protein